MAWEDKKVESAPTGARRKIVKLIVALHRGFNRTFAVCDDGTAWMLSYDCDEWTKLPEIPQ